MSGDTDVFVESQMDGTRDGTISVGDSPPSFDDFDTIKESRREYVEAKTGSKASKKSEKEDDSSASKEKVSKAVEEKNAEREEGDKNTHPSLAPNPEKTSFKTIKGNFGDQTVEVASDTTFTQPVNGKEERVTLQELLNNYSGKTNWDRKYGELHKETSQFKQERDQVFGQLGKFAEIAKQGKSLDAMKYLVETFGGNYHNFYNSLRDAMIPEVSSFLEMTDEERIAAENSRRAEYLKEQNQSLLSKREQEKAEQDLLLSEYKVRETWGISKDDFEGARSEILANSEGMSEQEREQVLKDVRNPEFVANYMYELQIINQAEEIAKSVDPGLLRDYQNVISIAQFFKDDPDVDPKYVAEEVKKALGLDREAQVLNEKMREGAPVTKNLKEKQSTARFESFNDFEEDEYHGNY